MKKEKTKKEKDVVQYKKKKKKNIIKINQKKITKIVMNLIEKENQDIQKKEKLLTNK